MILYVMVAFAVFGNMTTAEVVSTKDFALAQAALPIFGQSGFTVVAITALIATASAINANLYAVTNVTYQLAKDGELPAIFGKRIAHSREGLIISGILIIIISLSFDLSKIAAIGSISILFIHSVTHIGHIRLIKKTGASYVLVLLAAIFSFIAMVLALIYVSKSSVGIITILGIFVIVAAVIEYILQKFKKRKITPRIV